MGGVHYCEYIGTEGQVHYQCKRRRMWVRLAFWKYLWFEIHAEAISFRYVLCDGRVSAAESMKCVSVVR